MFVNSKDVSKVWPIVVKNSFVKPAPDSIILTASAEATLVAPAEVIDGTTLNRCWQDIVTSTHPDYGDVDKSVSPSIFLPLDLEHFLAVRVRAVSAMEKWGPNINGDAFPANELEASHQSLIAKGFYDEHNSFDPINAMGIIAHAQWFPEQQYVECVALIDKVLFPEEADMVRHAFRTSKKAGVSIGCIAGSAECSICGNVARKRGEICAHMDRSNSGCIKGRSLPDRRLAYDICRDLKFYELSFTTAPADRDALPTIVQGADISEPKDKEVVEKDTDKEPEGAAPAVDIKMPDEAMLNKLIDRAVNQAIKSRVNKLVKAEIDRALGPYLRQLQVDVKPDIKDKVEEKKEEVKDVTDTKPV